MQRLCAVRGQGAETVFHRLLQTGGFRLLYALIQHNRTQNTDVDASLNAQKTSKNIKRRLQISYTSTPRSVCVYHVEQGV